jgi:hypothetical protein
MDRTTTFLLALIFLAVAAATVGVTGWVLFVREHRLVKAAHADGPSAGAAPHPEVPEES